ncbi:MAG: hypothetical protein MJ113_00135 [Lachnospiraceae bacterium]|nr:hypothetical protein [Lachnospiraceae bacterium]
MQIKKIYLDMDGVLADFDKGVQDLLGLPRVDQGKRTEEENRKLHQSMREYDHFYDHLELLPHAKEMFNYIYGRFGKRCEVLSGIPVPKKGIATAKDDKIAWMRRNLSEDIKMNIVLRSEKVNYCEGRDCILIDDFSKNIEEWEAAGGTGILFTSWEDTKEKLENLSTDDRFEKDNSLF